MKKIIIYADGSGNTYIIDFEEKILEYKPVKPLHSSSGVYDGGDYKKQKLSESDCKNIMERINNAVENKAVHIENRVMMSGLIRIQENSNETVYIIKSGSKEQIHIENLLQEILQ